MSFVDKFLPCLPNRVKVFFRCGYKYGGDLYTNAKKNSNNRDQPLEMQVQIIE